MKSKAERKITSFEELNAAKIELANTIKNQEEEILKNPLFTIPSALFQGGSLKGNIMDSMESISLDHYKKAAMNLLSTALMANRRTRKFFIGFIIAKEMVPFIRDKVNEYVKK
ncbi:hypothetical protein [Lutimonas sp.]|uniref:hypothetical protein n=1 Tax=Lutimonas sp. TaxID=1872403 RepID=UPI003D9BF184